jgi:uncharacterized protein (UPF0297 family)
MLLYMATTEDNPFDPFDDFENWNQFDQEKGYNTMNYIARIAMPSSDSGDEEYEATVNDAVNEIVRYNLTGNYRRVEREVNLDSD